MKTYREAFIETCAPIEIVERACEVLKRCNIDPNAEYVPLRFPEYPFEIVREKSHTTHHRHFFELVNEFWNVDFKNLITKLEEGFSVSVASDNLKEFLLFCTEAGIVPDFVIHNGFAIVTKR